MFERSPEVGGTAIAITVDGVRVVARDGDSVAAALLLTNVGWTRRSSVSGAPRAPYCMMGVCFECLVTIDGVTSEQACLVRVRDGMRIERPTRAPGMQA